MNWTKLIDCELETLARGAVMRFPAQLPYEAIVDFLVFDPQSSERGLGLMVCSGYKAGLINVILPPESAGEKGSGVLLTSWVIENWQHWIYPECDVAEVYILNNYPVPESF